MTALRKAHNRVLVFVVFTFTCMKGLISQELRRFSNPARESSRLSELQQASPPKADMTQVASLQPLSLRGMQISAVSTPSEQSSPSVKPICPPLGCDGDGDGDGCDGCDGCDSCDSCTC